MPGMEFVLSIQYNVLLLDVDTISPSPLDSHSPPYWPTHESVVSFKMSIYITRALFLSVYVRLGVFSVPKSASDGDNDSIHT